MSKPLITNAQLLKLRAIVEGNFDYTCSIQRRFKPAPALDEFGQPQVQTEVWSTVAILVPCFFQEKDTQSVYGERVSVDREYLYDRPVISFKVGTDVTAQDRITNLVDRFGQPVKVGNVYPSLFEILQVVPFKTTLRVDVKSIS